MVFKTGSMLAFSKSIIPNFFQDSHILNYQINYTNRTSSFVFPNNMAKLYPMNLIVLSYSPQSSVTPQPNQAAFFYYLELDEQPTDQIYYTVPRDKSIRTAQSPLALFPNKWYIVVSYHYSSANDTLNFHVDANLTTLKVLKSSNILLSNPQINHNITLLPDLVTPVTHIFQADSQSGGQLIAFGSTNNLALPLKLNDNLLPTYSYFECPSSLLYDEASGTCVDACPQSTAKLGTTCYNFKLDIPLTGTTWTGPGADTPTRLESRASLPSSVYNMMKSSDQANEYEIFAFRGSESLFYQRFVAFEAGNFPVSAARKVQVDNANPELLNVSLAEMAWHSNLVYKIHLWKVKKGRYTYSAMENP